MGTTWGTAWGQHGDSVGTEWGQHGDSRHSSGGTPTQHRLSPSPPAAVNGSTWGSAVGIGPGGGEELQIRGEGSEKLQIRPPPPPIGCGAEHPEQRSSVRPTHSSRPHRDGDGGGGRGRQSPTFTPHSPHSCRPPQISPPPPPQPAPQRCVIIYCVSACGAARPRPHSAVGWGAEPPYEGPQRDPPPPHVPSCCGGAQP